MKYSSPTIEMEHLETEEVMLLKISGNEEYVPYGAEVGFWEGKTAE